MYQRSESERWLQNKGFVQGCIRGWIHFTSIGVFQYSVQTRISNRHMLDDEVRRKEWHENLCRETKEYTAQCHVPSQCKDIQQVPNYFLRELFINKPPTMPAATAMPPTIATPIIPSFETLSSMRVLRLSACRFPGSLSSSKSLYLRASA